MVQRSGIATLPRTRRHWLLTCVLGIPAVARTSGTALDNTTMEAWLDLSEPVAAQASDRAQARRVAEQQESVGARLHELGVVEVSRVRHARNSILVRMSAAQVDLVRAIPGVVRVRAAHTLHPPKPMP